jgi:hypothetical protein
MILDEFQYVPELMRHLKVAIDSNRSPGRFLLTGSQQFSSLGSVSESLAGRCAVLTLPMLSCGELGIAGQEKLDAYLWRGGFPNCGNDRNWIARSGSLPTWQPTWKEMCALWAISEVSGISIGSCERLLCGRPIMRI